MKNEFNWRPYNPSEDFSLVEQWMGKRKFPVPMPEFLPPTAAVISHKEKPVALGFLFKTDANIASVGHLCSDIDAPKEVRQKAVEILLEFLAGAARNMGFGMVTCATNIEKLGLRFEKKDFEKVDENVSHFRRILCQ